MRGIKDPKRMRGRSASGVRKLAPWKPESPDSLQFKPSPKPAAKKRSKIKRVKNKSSSRIGKGNPAATTVALPSPRRIPKPWIRPKSGSIKAKVKASKMRAMRRRAGSAPRHPQSSRGRATGHGGETKAKPASSDTSSTGTASIKPATEEELSSTKVKSLAQNWDSKVKQESDKDKSLSRQPSLPKLDQVTVGQLVDKHETAKVEINLRQKALNLVDKRQVLSAALIDGKQIDAQTNEQPKVERGSETVPQIKDMKSNFPPSAQSTIRTDIQADESSDEESLEHILALAEAKKEEIRNTGQKLHLTTATSGSTLESTPEPNPILPASTADKPDPRVNSSPRPTKAGPQLQKSDKTDDISTTPAWEAARLSRARTGSLVYNGAQVTERTYKFINRGVIGLDTPLPETTLSDQEQEHDQRPLEDALRSPSKSPVPQQINTVDQKIHTTTKDSTEADLDNPPAKNSLNTTVDTDQVRREVVASTSATPEMPKKGSKDSTPAVPVGTLSIGTDLQQFPSDAEETLETDEDNTETKLEVVTESDIQGIRQRLDRVRGITKTTQENVKKDTNFANEPKVTQEAESGDTAHTTQTTSDTIESIRRRLSQIQDKIITNSTDKHSKVPEETKVKLQDPTLIEKTTHKCLSQRDSLLPGGQNYTSVSPDYALSGDLHPIETKQKQGKEIVQDQSTAARIANPLELSAKISAVKDEIVSNSVTESRVNEEQTETSGGPKPKFEALKERKDQVKAAIVIQKLWRKRKSGHTSASKDTVSTNDTPDTITSTKSVSAGYSSDLSWNLPRLSLLESEHSKLLGLLQDSAIIETAQEAKERMTMERAARMLQRAWRRRKNRIEKNKSTTQLDVANVDDSAVEASTVGTQPIEKQPIESSVETKTSNAKKKKGSKTVRFVESPEEEKERKKRESQRKKSQNSQNADVQAPSYSQRQQPTVSANDKNAVENDPIVSSSQSLDELDSDSSGDESLLQLTQIAQTRLQRAAEPVTLTHSPTPNQPLNVEFTDDFDSSDSDSESSLLNLIRAAERRQREKQKQVSELASVKLPTDAISAGSPGELPSRSPAESQPMLSSVPRSQTIEPGQSKAQSRKPVGGSPVIETKRLKDATSIAREQPQYPRTALKWEIPTEESSFFKKKFRKKRSFVKFELKKKRDADRSISGTQGQVKKGAIETDIKEADTAPTESAEPDKQTAAVSQEKTNEKTEKKSQVWVVPIPNSIFTSKRQATRVSATASSTASSDPKMAGTKKSTRAWQIPTSNSIFHTPNRTSTMDSSENNVRLKDDITSDSTAKDKKYITTMHTITPDVVPEHTGKQHKSHSSQGTSASLASAATTTTVATMDSASGISTTTLRDTGSPSGDRASISTRDSTGSASASVPFDSTKHTSLLCTAEFCYCPRRSSGGGHTDTRNSGDDDAQEGLFRPNSISASYNLVGKITRQHYRVFSRSQPDDKDAIVQLKSENGTMLCGRPFAWITRRALSEPEWETERQALFMMKPQPFLLFPVDIISQQTTQMLVFPWSPLGSLPSYLRLHPGTSSAVRIEMTKQLLSAVAFLHSQTPAFVHGAIHPANVLVFPQSSHRHTHGHTHSRTHGSDSGSTKTSSESAQYGFAGSVAGSMTESAIGAKAEKWMETTPMVKLCDFGASARWEAFNVSSSIPTLTTKGCWSFGKRISETASRWQAPEALRRGRRRRKGETKADPRSDMFSLGLVSIWLLTKGLLTRHESPIHSFSSRTQSHVSFASLRTTQSLSENESVLSDAEAEWARSIQRRVEKQSVHSHLSHSPDCTSSNDTPTPLSSATLEALSTCLGPTLLLSRTAQAFASNLIRCLSRSPIDRPTAQSLHLLAPGLKTTRPLGITQTLPEHISARRISAHTPAQTPAQDPDYYDTINNINTSNTTIASRLFRYGLFLHFLMRNSEESLKCHSTASTMGHPRAQYALSCRLSTSTNAEDRKAAVKWLEKSAERGYADAQFNLACALLTGHGEASRDQKAAVRWFAAAAGSGHAKAQFNLASCFDRGIGVKQNPTRALELYRRSAVSGHPKAQFMLACALHGIGRNSRRGSSQVDIKSAIGWYGRAAAAGHPRAQYHFAMCLLKGAGGMRRDPQRALAYLQRSARQGHIKAQYNLGVCYERGLGSAKSSERALFWFNKAASKGHLKAQLSLAQHYDEISGDEKNSRLWWGRAAAQGSAEAQFTYGLMMDSGQGGPRDPKGAAAAYLQASKQGHVKAQRFLAFCYQNGNGVDKDGSQAIRWYTCAAQQGDGKSMYMLGLSHFHGVDVDKDAKTAVTYFQSAADKGDSDAKLLLGQCLAEGLGTVQNVNLAKRWLLEAAESGNSEAMYDLSRMLRQGNHDDQHDSGKWLKMSADKGHTRAQYFLALAYRMGEIGIQQSDTLAAVWFRKAAVAGDSYAQFNLGVCLDEGLGVAQDPAEATKWYKKAARQGDADAQYNLAYSFQYGLGVRRDMKEALRWYTRAAQQGHDAARFNLGLCYATGNGIRKNLQAAIRWYSSAARGGHSRAQFNLGLSYDLAKDPAEASKWYRRSAEQGHVKAKYNLSLLYQQGVVYSVYKCVTHQRAAREGILSSTMRRTPFRKSSNESKYASFFSTTTQLSTESAAGSEMSPSVIPSVESKANPKSDEERKLQAVIRLQRAWRRRKIQKFEQSGPGLQASRPTPPARLANTGMMGISSPVAPLPGPVLSLEAAAIKVQSIWRGHKARLLHSRLRRAPAPMQNKAMADKNGRGGGTGVGIFQIG